jgi:archaeal flagellar protein FlaJ
MSQNIYDIADRTFGPLVNSLDTFVKPLDLKLKMASMKVSGARYLALALLMGVLIFVMAFIFIFIFGTLLSGFYLINIFIYFIFSMVIAVVSGAFIYLYPNFVISDRKAKIENSLPFVTIYLSTIVRSGFPPQEMFKLLGKFKDYKIIASEARRISSDIHGLSEDMPNALSRAMARSPSPSWTELLAGLRNSVTVGGEISTYLEEKAKGFIDDYKRKLEEFSSLLSLMMNLYITVVIVGIIFFVVISSLIVTVGGISVQLIKTMQYLIVFVGLPVITAVFIMVIKGSSPWSSGD